MKLRESRRASVQRTLFSLLIFIIITIVIFYLLDSLKPKTANETSSEPSLRAKLLGQLCFPNYNDYTLPIQPISAWTSLLFVFIGLQALLDTPTTLLYLIPKIRFSLVKQSMEKLHTRLLFAFVMLLTGFGSFAFHSLNNGLSGHFDIIGTLGILNYILTFSFVRVIRQLRSPYVFLTVFLLLEGSTVGIRFLGHVNEADYSTDAFIVLCTLYFVFETGVNIGLFFVRRKDKRDRQPSRSESKNVFHATVYRHQGITIQRSDSQRSRSSIERQQGTLTRSPSSGSQAQQSLNNRLQRNPSNPTTIIPMPRQPVQNLQRSLSSSTKCTGISINDGSTLASQKCRPVVARHVLHVKDQSRRFRRTDSRWFFLGLVFMIIGFTCWILDPETLHCGDESPLHGAWHIFTALAALFTYYYSISSTELDGIIADEEVQL